MIKILFYALAGAFIFSDPALAAEGAAEGGPPFWMMIPFVLLLGMIALGPTMGPRWWGKYYPLFCCIPTAAVIFFYVGHRGETRELLTAASDYFSFITLVGALFVISSGVWIKINRPGTPRLNTLLLLFGGILANFLGTTGASMLLIRPYLSINRGRLHGYHLAFFIFIVSNIGGLLTPIGDPPLFLGYLKGVPFLWVFRAVWPIWLLAIGVLLFLFFMLDRRHYRKEETLRSSETEGRKADPSMRRSASGVSIQIFGKHQFLLLGVIIGAIFLKSPLREGIILIAAALSYLTASEEVHQGNQFDFAPLREVAILFFAIFATMVPALAWLSIHASQLGLAHPAHFFWGAGLLSSVLDNAPTYLNFFTAVLGLYPGLSVESFLSSHGVFIQAISVGSVFFGANTYIGNGPNFMVKSIAAQHGMATPSFFGYIVRYAFPILIPLYLLIWFLFFRTL